MKLSIPSFMVAASLLAPQVVESMKTTPTAAADEIAAVAIDRLHKAVRPASGRSLEEYSIFGDLDDDQVLALLGNLDIDPDLETCFSATEALVTAYSDKEGVDVSEQNAELMEDVITFPEMDLANGKMSIRMEFTQEIRNFMKQICSSVGGKYELVEDITCMMSDPESGFEVTTEMVGVAQCWANIPECKAGTTKALFEMIYTVSGGVCSSSTASSMISMTGTASNGSTDGVAIEGGSGALRESGGAGLGFQIKTASLAMAGMLVAVSAFL